MRSPAWRTVLSPPRAARRPCFARRFRVVFLLARFAARVVAVFRVDRFLADDGRFLADARLAPLRFFPVLRFADFLVGAIWSSTVVGTAKVLNDVNAMLTPLPGAVAQVTRAPLGVGHITAPTQLKLELTFSAGYSGRPRILGSIT